MPCMDFKIRVCFFALQFIEDNLRKIFDYFLMPEVMYFINQGNPALQNTVCCGENRVVGRNQKSWFS